MPNFVDTEYSNRLQDYARDWTDSKLMRFRRSHADRAQQLHQFMGTLGEVRVLAILDAEHEHRQSIAHAHDSITRAEAIVGQLPKQVLGIARDVKKGAGPNGEDLVEVEIGGGLAPSGMQTPKKEGAPTWNVPCQKCKHTSVVPLGTLDPTEGRCAHVFDFDPRYGLMGGLVCRGCSLVVDARQIQEANERFAPRYDRRAADLADKLQKADEELTSAHANNAKLRAQLDAYEKKDPKKQSKKNPLRWCRT